MLRPLDCNYLYNEFMFLLINLLILKLIDLYIFLRIRWWKVNDIKLITFDGCSGSLIKDRVLDLIQFLIDDFSLMSCLFFQMILNPVRAFLIALLASQHDMISSNYHQDFPFCLIICLWLINCFDGSWFRLADNVRHYESFFFWDRLIMVEPT